MSRFLSLHALQPVPASLLNRDDRDSVKTIAYGGTTRIRVSSQSWKRAMRLWMREHDTNHAYGQRTNRLPHLVAEALVAAHGRDQDIAPVKAAAAFTALGLKLNAKTGDTAVGLFVPTDAAVLVATSIDSHWDAISDKKVPDEVITDLKHAVNPREAIDINLFGRFLTELPGGTVDGAAAVAHAMGVDAARIMPDFYTAVDDAAPADAPVSANLGVVDLAAPVLYRHAALNRPQATANLGEPSLALAAESAFTEAFLYAVPAAKRNSTAATTLPSFLLGVASDRDTSLADAFTQAIASDDVLTDASERLLDHASRALRFVPNAHAVLLPVTADPKMLPAVEGVTTVSSLTEFKEALATVEEPHA